MNFPQIQFGLRLLASPPGAGEHRLPSLCAKQAFSLFHVSRLQARWAHRQKCLCFDFVVRAPFAKAFHFGLITHLKQQTQMKTETIILIAVSLFPLTAFSQPQTPPPAPPNPPAAPVPPVPPRDRDRDREDRMPKVPVTFLGVETSEVPSVLCDQLG